MVSDEVLNHLAGVFAETGLVATRSAPAADSWDSQTRTEVGIHLDPIGGRFKVIASLGSGSMGAVYLATDLETGREVAVKVPHLLSAFVDRRFELEIDALAAVVGPASIGLVARGTSSDPYVAMEVVRGRSLARRLVEDGPMPRHVAIATARRIAAALAVVHLGGWVHRDVKPSNLVLTDEGSVRVVDYGLARTLDGPGAGTATGQLVGTLHYLAPEQFALARIVDPRTDVFALGCVLFECLTGRRAWQRDMSDIISGKWAPERHPKLDVHGTGLDDKLCVVIEQLVDNDARKRTESGLAALELLLGLDPSAVPLLGLSAQQRVAVHDAVKCALVRPIAIIADQRVALAAAVLAAEVLAPAGVLLARCGLASFKSPDGLLLHLERALRATGYTAAARLLAGTDSTRRHTEDPALVLVLEDVGPDDAELVRRAQALATAGLACLIVTVRAGAQPLAGLEQLHVVATGTEENDAGTARGGPLVSFVRRTSARIS